MVYNEVMIKRLSTKTRPRKFSLPEVKQQSEVLWEDKFSGGAIRLTLLWLLISVGLLTWLYGKLPSQVPLLYSRPWGETQLVAPFGLALLPGGTAIILLINGYLAAAVFESQKLLARILTITASLAGFLATVSLIRITLLVL